MNAPIRPDFGDCKIWSITAVGSRVTCDPAPTDTDQDWLLYVEAKDYRPLLGFLLASKWEPGGSLVPVDESYRPPNERFNSFKLGVDNAIVTDSMEFHKRFLAASSIAKRLNLLEKADRIALFQAVLYGNECEQALTPYWPSNCNLTAL